MLQRNLMNTWAIWSVVICVTTLQPGSKAAINTSTLNSVLMKNVASASLEELLNYEKSSSTFNRSCFNAMDSEDIIESCLANQCLNAQAIANLYGVSVNASLGDQAVSEVAPAVLYTLTRRSSCVSDTDTMSKQGPSPSAVWGYSFLFVTLINLCSLTGIIVLPCMKTAMYQIILMFMVALAVGTLVGSGVLVLIPEAFELAHVGGGQEGHSDDSYIWISTSIIGGIYLFFLIERVMRIVNVWRENTKEKKRRDKLATRGTLTSSFTRKTPYQANMEMKNPANLHLVESPSSDCLCHMDIKATDNNPPSSGKGSCEEGEEEEAAAVISNAVDVDGVLIKDDEGITNTSGALVQKTKGEMNGHGHSHHAITGSDGQVAPVAYMVIFGDGLHNFIDGLSIGAAFTDSILLGISVSVAVMCEELPHELGDFAILLNAGMRLRRALMYNFLSSLMCYFGLVLGILVGENTTAHTWIFGVAGGMFLYIALVDMMPEMNSASESKEGKKFGIAKTFLIQNLGLLSGYAIILCMSLYGDTISFE